MWKKQLVFAALLLTIAIGLLVLSNLNADNRVRAEAPARAANSSSTIFLPFIAQNFTPPITPLWRFGIDKARLPISAHNSLDVAAMRLGWYVDFGVSATPESLYGMEYIPTVRVKQKKKIVADGTETYCYVSRAVGDFQYLNEYTISPPLTAIPSIAAARPGMTWVVGNEMERIDWPADGSCAHQDEMLPEVYAQVYHDVYTAIKSADPTAQVAIGALVQPSDLRIKYLQRVWDEYDRLYGNGQVNTMPVDVWTIHVYVFQERRCQPDPCWGADIPAGLTETTGALYTVADHKNFNLAAQMLVKWRTWMNNHGQRQKPLFTPEYGVVFPEGVQDPPGVTLFSPAQVKDEFMYPSFNYFLNHTDRNLGFTADGNRLMQRWAWWSLDYDDGKCEDDDKDGIFEFYQHNNGNLFYSGLGPSLPPKDCPYPWQGRAPLWTYWVQYVIPLPAGSAKPYASALTARAPQQSNALRPSAAPSAVLRMADDAAQCSDSPAARARLFKALPRRDTPEGQRAWLTVLSKLTAGTRICLP